MHDVSKHFRHDHPLDDISDFPQARPQQIHAATTCISKRAIDVGVALGLLVLLLPLGLVIAAVILLDSGGPVFFRQRRTGLKGRTFKIYKFRTMTVTEDGDTIRHAQRDDKRVTRVGHFLRRSHWDELPQLINVLAGHMTLIGPRPHAVAHDRFYGSAFPNYKKRFSVRPGLTGLAQVAGFRGEVFDLDCMRQRMEADIRYVEEWSIKLDLIIALRTIPLLLGDSKAY